MQDYELWVQTYSIFSPDIVLISKHHGKIVWCTTKIRSFSEITYNTSNYALFKDKINFTGNLNGVKKYILLRTGLSVKIPEEFS